jgi:hypothetical protein
MTDDPKKFQIDPNNLQNLVQRQMYDDPSGGTYNMRIMLQLFEMASQSEMSEDERASVFDLLHVISLKFASIWTHDHRYETREKELITAAEANPTDRRKNEPIRFASAQDLYIELDGFLVQCKSVLDHMIVILHYTLGINFSSLSTFGDHGNKVIKLLKTNVGANPPSKRKCAGYLITHIERNQEWLKGMIDIRDRMNHFMSGGISPMAFGIASIIEQDGTQNLHRPRMTKDLTVKDYMSTLMNNILEFIEYFMGLAISVRAPGYAVKYTNSDDPKAKRWKMIHGAIVEQMIASGQLDPSTIK